MIETITAREQEPNDPTVMRLFEQLLHTLHDDEFHHTIEHTSRNSRNDVVMTVNDTVVWIKDGQYGINWDTIGPYTAYQFTDLEGAMMRLHHQPAPTLHIIHKAQGVLGVVAADDADPMLVRLLRKESIDTIPRYTPMDMVEPELRGIDGPYVLMEQAHYNFRKVVPVNEQFTQLDEAVDFIDEHNDPYLRLYPLPLAFDLLAGHNILTSPRKKPVDALVPRAQRGTI